MAAAVERGRRPTKAAKATAARLTAVRGELHMHSSRHTRDEEFGDPQQPEMSVGLIDCPG